MSDSKGNLTLGGVLYDGFEMLDFYGPLEMFGMLSSRIKIVTVAEHTGPVSASQGPQTIAEFNYDNCPHLDLILIPGGYGTYRELDNQVRASRQDDCLTLSLVQ